MPEINNRDLRKATLLPIPHNRPFLTYSLEIQL